MRPRGRHGQPRPSGAPPPPGAVVRVVLPGHEAGLRSAVHERAPHELVITAPVEDRTARELPLGGELELSWTTERGVDRLDVQLRDRLDGNPPRWRVGLVAGPEREQRRAGYRVPLMTAVEVQVDGPWRTAQVIDLSVGGLRCLLPAEARPAQGADCRVALDLVRPDLQLHGVAVRVQEGVDGMADVGVQFVGVPADVTDELRRYLFETQLDFEAQLDRRDPDAG